MCEMKPDKSRWGGFICQTQETPHEGRFPERGGTFCGRVEEPLMKRLVLKPGVNVLRDRGNVTKLPRRVLSYAAAFAVASACTGAAGLLAGRKSAQSRAATNTRATMVPRLKMPVVTHAPIWKMMSAMT